MELQDAEKKAREVTDKLKDIKYGRHVMELADDQK